MPQHGYNVGDSRKKGEEKMKASTANELQQTNRVGKVACGLKTFMLGVGACFILAVHAASPEELQPQTGATTSGPQPLAQKPAAVPEGGGGMIIHIDPQTGELRRTPAPSTVPLQLSPQERNAFSTSHQGLVEVPSSVPGGGVKLDLQGRFHSPLAVTVDPDGKLKMQHLGEPGSGDKNPRQ
jgi:hypothetical protein